MYSDEEDDFETSGVSDFLLECLEVIDTDNDKPANKLPKDVFELLEDDLKQELLRLCIINRTRA